MISPSDSIFRVISTKIKRPLKSMKEKIFALSRIIPSMKCSNLYKNYVTKKKTLTLCPKLCLFFYFFLFQMYLRSGIWCCMATEKLFFFTPFSSESLMYVYVSLHDFFFISTLYSSNWNIYQRESAARKVNKFSIIGSKAFFLTRINGVWNGKKTDESDLNGKKTIQIGR